MTKLLSSYIFSIINHKQANIVLGYCIEDSHSPLWKIYRESTVGEEFPEWISPLGTSRWNSYTLCGRFKRNIVQRVCDFQMNLLDMPLH